MIQYNLEGEGTITLSRQIADFQSVSSVPLSRTTLRTAIPNGNELRILLLFSG